MRQALPGDLLIRPVPIAAGLLLAVNDHVLKAQLGNTVTGKLSDAAGLVFVPLLLLGLLELGRAVCRRAWAISIHDVAVATGIVALLLVGAKVFVPVADVLGDVGGVLQYPFRGRFDALTITHDPSDVLMLPAVAFAALEAASVIRARKRLHSVGHANVVRRPRARPQL